MQERPSMPARDSSGRHISLLNDDSILASSRIHRPSHGAPDLIRSSSRDSLPSSAASPATPDLTRADSFDSHRTSEPRSPITPDSLTSAAGRPDSFTNNGGAYKDSVQPSKYDQRMHPFDYNSQSQYQMPSRPSYHEPRQSPYPHPHAYDDEPYPNRSANVPITEKGQKRYVCRFANEFNCDKTFTTSGHASRHSKIHTAEKAVPCSYNGCPKKFTRSDNMKQHLETHFKERTRSPITGRSGPPVLTKPACIKKVGYRSRSSSVSELSPISTGNLDPALRLPVPASASHPYDFSPSFEHALDSPSRSGLDALAMAAAQAPLP
ncbi:Transcriptional regulator [Lachnellula hyalina]|uniref:Transcriptional regulator n=1 Tax=Lachnellula hyalina TaxID=1316788 RepID=A0A8H8QTZ4_9HELO|nr:Transcriptional regulator [Lachnellula hyalina]TVY22733.1 Transcriptional regulator [Lachnellula hyalina]